MDAIPAPPHQPAPAEPFYQPTPLSTPTRKRERVRYDETAVHQVWDEALICHLGYHPPAPDGADDTVAQAPVVLPTLHVRVGSTLYLHGSTGSGPALAVRRSGDAGLPVCVTATLVDALVLARTATHHSLNYRSAVARGLLRLVTDPQERQDALDALLDHVLPGRRADVRPSTAAELARTAVLALPLRDEAGTSAVAAKSRTGDPVDEPENLDHPCWAGLVPLTAALGAPTPAADLHPGTPTPSYLTAGQSRPLTRQA